MMLQVPPPGMFVHHLLFVRERTLSPNAQVSMFEALKENLTHFVGSHVLFLMSISRAHNSVSFL